MFAFGMPGIAELLIIGIILLVPLAIIVAIVIAVVIVLRGKR